MRHCKIKGRLNRRTSWRNSTLRSLTRDLIRYQRIRTTLAKAKALRSFVEPLITIAKKDPDGVNSRRRVYQELSDREAVVTLFKEIAPLFKDVPGGYTRIMHLGRRRGDGAKMAILELTKKTIADEDLLGPAGEKKEKKKSKKKKRETEKTNAAPEAEKTDTSLTAEKKKKKRAQKEQKQAREKDKTFLGKFRRGDR